MLTVLEYAKSKQCPYTKKAKCNRAKIFNYFMHKLKTKMLKFKIKLMRRIQILRRKITADKIRCFFFFIEKVVSLSK